MNAQQQGDRLRMDPLALSEFTTTDRFALEAYCRAQAQPVYLGDHTALCRILARYKFYVDTRDHGFGSNVLLDGAWEMWITMLIASTVKLGMVAIDIGANFGYYSLLLADLVGPTGRVVAVEPNPATAIHLRNSLSLNGFAQRTTVIEAAAGATDGGQRILFSPSGEPKNATIVATADQVGGRPGTIFQVPEVTVDTLMNVAGRVDFLKIDAEGAEEAIIAGMEETFARHKPMMVLEFNAARSHDPMALLKTLTTIYGVVHYIDYSGAPVAVLPDRLLSERRGEDWMLFFTGGH